MERRATATVASAVCGSLLEVAGLGGAVVLMSLLGSPRVSHPENVTGTSPLAVIF